ncbi:hypothetical protein IV203_016853 [Nitzschia inconspicua]|uniref:Uncharacterized protein n=1 Tax=Nitzschia inconspicua TaxID=303405 RepID=A0A9K3PI18_9STRA|nr:hypothetical protein IV203_016853 [Nitzschia inconspicua]
MSLGGRSAASSQQSSFARQATILRRNLGEWDMKLHDPRGEDWPKMLGRLNAAMNQTMTMDKSIEDVMEHFVYLPKRPTANPQDIPFFLSTKLDSTALDERTTSSSGTEKTANTAQKDALMEKFLALEDPVQVLSKYEEQAARLVGKYEEEMVRF